MENQVIFRDRQELQAADLNNIETYARDSIDHIVNDAVNGGSAYWGFTVTKIAATQVSAAPGRFYNAGAVYPLLTSTTIDLFSNLPLVTQKFVAIVVNGVDQSINIQPRDFLTDVTTGATQPQSVAMQDQRSAVLSIIAGTEAPQPSVPAIPTTVTVIAYVLLDTSGVVTIQQVASTQLANLTTTLGLVQAIQTWQTQVSSQIDSLATAISNINAALRGFATETELQQVVAKLNQLIGVVNALPPPSNPWLFYGTKYFLDTSGADTGNGSFSAQINEGITFPAGGSASTTLTLLNSLEPKVTQTSDGYILPAYYPKLRYTCTTHDNVLNIGTLVFRSAAPCRLLDRRRHRIRYGECFHPITSSEWWKVGGFDPIFGNLCFDGEVGFITETIENVYEVINPADPYEITGIYAGCRRDYFWEDFYDYAPYWDRVVTNFNVSGQQFSQVFLNSQDGWLTNVSLFFTKLDTSGDLHVKICHVDKNGAPDLDNVVGHVVFPYANITPPGVVLIPGNVSFNGLDQVQVTPSETCITLPPTFLKGGTRYALVVTTPGLHSCSFSVNDFLVWNDHHWYWDGIQWVVDVTRVLHARLYYAAWGPVQDISRLAIFYDPINGNGQIVVVPPASQQLRYEIQMQALQLAGGIQSIDVLAQAEVPSACSLSYQVQLNNKWYPLDIQGSGPDLSSLPALLPFRVVFQGTTDIMPAVSLTKSQVKLGKPATSFTYLSTSQSIATPATQMKISTVLSNFNGGTHTCVTKIKANSTTYTATSVVDTTLANGTIQRDSTFNFGGVQASGTVTFTVQPTDASTVTIGGVAVTFKTSPTSGNQVAIGSNLAGSITDLVTWLNGSLDAALRQASYSGSSTVLTVKYKNVGVAGNAFAIATTVTGATASGSTLSGGTEATPVSSYVVEIDGTTTGSGSTFRVKEETDFAKSGPT